MKVKEINGKEYKLPNQLNQFQKKMYVHLINWKWRNISEEPGNYKYRNQLIPCDAILPKTVIGKDPLIYPDVVNELDKHRRKYPFKNHKFFNHIASSQVANINLFLPILLNIEANTILSHLKDDFKRLAVDELYKGFRLEFWDGNCSKDKGSLKDHTAVAGTDSDIAIAYYNHDDELCLWLIEHKLTESEFTKCGGAVSKSKKRKVSHQCNKTLSEIIQNKDSCFYHSICGYEYWNITEKNQAFFQNNAQFITCPFRGGLSQLWRNQLLGFTLENQGKYKHVYFSVVHHPENTKLERSIALYKKLTGNNPKFSVFTSREVVNAASLHNNLDLEEWALWYKELYVC